MGIETVELKCCVKTGVLSAYASDNLLLTNLIQALCNQKCQCVYFWTRIVNIICYMKFFEKLDCVTANWCFQT